MTNVQGDEYGELARVHQEIADVGDAVQEVREVQREHSARLDQHFAFHQSHAAGLAMLADTAREHGEALREILRRLDAA